MTVQRKRVATVAAAYWRVVVELTEIVGVLGRRLAVGMAYAEPRLMNVTVMPIVLSATAATLGSVDRVRAQNVSEIDTAMPAASVKRSDAWSLRARTGLDCYVGFQGGAVSRRLPSELLCTLGSSIAIRSHN